MFFMWSRITLFWGNFEPPKICLRKDFNFSHVCVAVRVMTNIIASAYFIKFCNPNIDQKMTICTLNYSWTEFNVIYQISILLKSSSPALKLICVISIWILPIIRSGQVIIIQLSIAKMVLITFWVYIPALPYMSVKLLVKSNKSLPNPDKVCPKFVQAIRSAKV